MRKRILSVFLTLTMLAAVLPVLPTAAADESPFTDVSTDHWAYDTIVTLTDEGVINGVGDNMFSPEGTLTKAQMTKLIVCTADTYDETIDYHNNFADVADGEWYTEYIANGVAAGMYGGNYSQTFEPDSALTRGECAEWIINTLGIESEEKYTYPDVSDSDVAEAVSNATAAGLITGYEDGTYRPDGSLTRAEAATIILRVMNYLTSQRSVREDAANEIVLNEDVVIAESSSNVNVPVASDADACTVTFKNADETLTELEAGDILYMEPSDNIPQGLVGKVADISSGTYTTVKLEQAEIEDVIESIDISAYFGVDESMVGDDGEFELMSNTADASAYMTTLDYNAGSSVGRALTAVESKENGVDFDADADGDISNFSLWHRSVSADANANITSSLHFETPSYANKDGVYAAVDMSLGVMLNFVMNVWEGELNVFSISTNVTTNIESTVGYNKSGSKSASYDLPTINVPVAGVVNIVITSKLTVSASGEVSVVSNAELGNCTGMSYSLTNGLTTYSYTFADSGLSVNAEGRVKAGPEINVAINLCKITIPFINKTIYDGFDNADASFKVGIGIEGKLSRSVDVSVSNAGASVMLDDTDDEIHLCYFCVEGDIYYYYSGEAGLSDDVKKIFDKISSSGKKLRKTFVDEERKLYDWHLSSGDGYTNEFELEVCPHVMYKVYASASDANDTASGFLDDVEIKAINNESSEITTSFESASQSAANIYTAYLAPGTYTVTAEKDGYESAEMQLTVTTAGASCTFNLGMDEFSAAIDMYAEVLEGYANDTTASYAFALAYIDEDDIPEMILGESMLSAFKGTLNIYSVLNDTLTRTYFNEELPILEFSSKCNFMYSADQKWGYVCYYFQSLDENKMLVDKHTLAKPGAMSNGGYWMDGNEVSKDYYNNKFNSLRENYERITFNALDYEKSFEVTKSNIADMKENPKKYILG